jgi:hypothetical protein
VSDPESERPELTPLRAAAPQAEPAEAFRGLLSADGYSTSALPRLGCERDAMWGLSDLASAIQR